MSEHIGADPTCPCRDDPCTLCGEPADGVCQLDTLKGWKHRAEQAEAEVVRLRRWQDEAMAVLAEWDNVHDALGQPGDLGQSKALASHFEVVRLRRELDARTDEFIKVDYWCHFDGNRAVRVHDVNSVHMDGCTRMYVRRAASLLGGGE